MEILNKTFGDVNGYETTLLITSADAVGGMSSASLSIDLGDMGKVTFDQGVGAGGISTIDDKTPSAAEEVWDNLDAVTGDENGLVGGGNSGVFVYANEFMGSSLSAQFGKGGSAATAYFKSRTYPGAVMNSMLVYMQENKADGADAAVEFLRKHEDIWTKWVPADVVAKVKASL